jgi:exonuclease III
MNKIHAFSLISLTLFSLSLLQAAECDKLKVMSYNICTLFKTYDTHLDINHRIPRILDQINKESPDVIVLQEARKVEADVLKEHLSQTGYCPILSSVNETPLAATLITAFKHKQFVCKETICWWYNNENPNIFGGNDWYKWGRILTATMIYRANDPQQKPIVICNTHL